MTRSLNVLLAISLFFNVFAAGAIGGGLVMLSRSDIRQAPAVAAPRPLRSAGDVLPAPDRDRFRQTLQQVARENRDLVRIGRDNRQIAARLFVQPTFDQAAVSAALERARNADVHLRMTLETAAVGFAATLPPDERALLAQSLERGGPLRHPAEPAPAGANRAP
jgi:uncharacterized membrane protein